MSDLMTFDKTIVKELNRVQEYLYTIDYETIDYNYAKAYFEDRYVAQPFGCSAVRAGNWYGRNYDWTYGNQAYFVIRTAAAQGRYASVGMAGGLPKLTNELVESRVLSQMYRALPFVTVDGINEKGVCCNINVVPTGDKGITLGTNPGAERLCTMMLPRYILDYCATADEAIDAIRAHDIYAPHSETLSQELQIMIADSTKTYIVEFVWNEVVVLDVTSGRPYMTNFYLKDANVDNNGHIDISTLTPHAMGTERWNIIADGYSGISSLATMTALMTSLNYSQTYSTSVDPLWVSEYVGGDRKITDPYESFIPLVDEYHERWENRSRDKGDMWHTVHTAIYDLQNKKLYLIAQEENASNQKKYNLQHYYTSEEIDALI